jgi:hypothetical protein
LGFCGGGTGALEEAAAASRPRASEELHIG